MILYNERYTYTLWRENTVYTSEKFKSIVYSYHHSLRMKKDPTIFLFFLKTRPFQTEIL